ncbi:DUF397 domain-containing protein [Streptomyces sp. NPDC002838]|uniref:DUF397 domain-containing protein n=1 Tax=Streptomyces sp. NPDC002838 TaxID=3154436 RepID=UPI003316741C
MPLTVGAAMGTVARKKDDGRLMWTTSTYSNGAGGECVECALPHAHALVRDSEHMSGPVVAAGIEAWRVSCKLLAPVRCWAKDRTCSESEGSRHSTEIRHAVGSMSRMQGCRP